MYRLATKCTNKRIKAAQCKQRDVNKVSIRTARRTPCRRYDRLSQQQLSFLLFLVQFYTDHYDLS